MLTDTYLYLMQIRQLAEKMAQKFCIINRSISISFIKILLNIGESTMYLHWYLTNGSQLWQIFTASEDRKKVACGQQKCGQQKDDQSSAISRMMRKLIIETAVTSRMKEAEDKAITMFQNFMRKNVTVQPNFRFIAYTTGVRYCISF